MGHAVRGVGVGAGFLAELMDAKVREVVGPKGRSPKFHACGVTPSAEGSRLSGLSSSPRSPKVRRGDRRSSRRV
jgi:hypothetical protein